MDIKDEIISVEENLLKDVSVIYTDFEDYSDRCTFCHVRMR